MGIGTSVRGQSLHRQRRPSTPDEWASHLQGDFHGKRARLYPKASDNTPVLVRCVVRKGRIEILSYLYAKASEFTLDGQGRLGFLDRSGRIALFRSDPLGSRRDCGVRLDDSLVDLRVFDRQEYVPSDPWTQTARVQKEAVVA